MRILLDYRPALRTRTGVGEYVHELARALVASAPDSEVLTLFSSSWKDRLAPDAVPGARSIDRRVPVRLLNVLWHRLGWPPIEALAGQPFDVVQASHPLLVPARHAAQLVTVYDLDFLAHPERTRAEIRRDYPGLAAAHAERADRVIVISEHTARDVERQLGVRRSKISICPPGAPAWPRRDVEPAPGCVLFLGTLGARKNLDTLLDAYAQLLSQRPGAPPLVLAGRITPEASDLVARTTRPPLAGHVEVLGYVEPDRRVDLYARALVLVLPSHMEGFGMTALEAMTSGVPVIAADRGALPELIGSAGRLIDPDDPAALAGALRLVLSDAGLRRSLRDAGWQRAQQFQWMDTARRTREAWALAVEERARSRRRG